MNTPTGKAVLSPTATQNIVSAYNAQDGTQLGSATLNQYGSFSNLSLTLPADKSVLVLKTTVSNESYRTLVPIDFSGFPLPENVSGNNFLNVKINQATTTVVSAVSEKLGINGILGDNGATLASVVKSYLDASQLIAANGGEAFVLRPSPSPSSTDCDGNRSMIGGTCRCPQEQPFWNASSKECIVSMPSHPLCVDGSLQIDGLCVCPSLPSPSSCKTGTQLVVSTPASTDGTLTRCPKAQCVEINCPQYMPAPLFCPNGSVPIVIPTFIIEKDFNGCPSHPRVICSETMCKEPACADMLCPPGFNKIVTPSIDINRCPSCPIQKCVIDREYCMPAESCPAAPDCGLGKVLATSHATPNEMGCQPCDTYACVDISLNTTCKFGLIWNDILKSCINDSNPNLCPSGQILNLESWQCISQSL
jgi:hypothetical protein